MCICVDVYYTRNIYRSPVIYSNTNESFAFLMWKRKRKRQLTKEILCIIHERIEEWAKARAKNNKECAWKYMRLWNVFVIFFIYLI